MKKPDIRDQFPRGMRCTLVNVAIERHRERYCGRTGVVVKAVKSRNTVWIEFPDGDRYGAYPENVRLPDEGSLAGAETRQWNRHCRGASREPCSQIDNGEECI